MFSTFPMMWRTLGRVCVASLAVTSAFGPAPAQGQQQPQPGITVQFPPVTVVAQKEPADALRLPVSVTPVSGQTIEDAGIRTVSDAAIYAPNVHFTEFTARKVSNARVRGIGASPANPSVTTYIDGVPQLNANSSSIELLQMDQIEFVRGPQSTLFGRNTLGGVINLTSRRPSVGGDWTGSARVPFSNYDERGFEASASGPLVADRLGAAAAFHYRKRDGFTRNAITGNDLDSRSSFAGKGQLLFTPTDRWDVRLIVSGERDRDGDYALSDLAGLRQTPYTAARDFEGFTERDILATTVQADWRSSRVTVSSTTGVVSWRAEDMTDLDYLPVPVAQRHNREESLQFTQEVRLASPASVPVRLSDALAFRWQTGVLFFAEKYDQDAVNTFAPQLPPGVSLEDLEALGLSVSPIVIVQQSPLAALDAVGVGVYGQGTVTLAGRLDVTAGVRADRERKQGVLISSVMPPIPIFPPDASVDSERTFSDVSPQFAVAYRVQPRQTVYGSASRGYKAGGFNAATPGRELYAEEHAWSFEGGVKSSWAGGRVMTNAAIFRIDWDALQINLPDLLVPGQFYIDNAASAVSTGVEVEVNARVRSGVDLFGSAGYTRARFDEAVVLAGANVGGNEIPNTPDFTSVVGAQLSHLLRPGTTMYGRVEVAVTGAFHYDERNTQAQDTYALANVRAGVRMGLVFVEGWVRNAFDTAYIPVAFEYPAFAPSGFIGEMGRPRTFGVTAGVAF
jgi:iron complex outermembrane recepter protein